MTFSFHSSPASHSFLSLKPVNPSTDAAESVNDLNRIKQNEQNCSAHPVRRSIIIVRHQSTVSVSVLALEGFAFLHLLAGLQHLSGGLAVCRCIVTISSNGLKKGEGREMSKHFISTFKVCCMTRSSNALSSSQGVMKRGTNAYSRPASRARKSHHTPHRFPPPPSPQHLPPSFPPPPPLLAPPPTYTWPA